MKPTASFSNFEALDVRVGRIVSVEDAATKKPTYKITVDFGPEIGKKVTCGAFRKYPTDKLVGKLVIGIVNFEPKRMGPETSEFLMLGVPDEKHETTYLTAESDVEIGVNVF